MGTCEYRYVCPTSKCESEKSIQCIGRLIDAVENIRQRNKKSEDVRLEEVEVGVVSGEIEILFACDHRACRKCKSGGNFDEKNTCQWTKDISHAKNFYATGFGGYAEKI